MGSPQSPLLVNWTPWKTIENPWKKRLCGHGGKVALARRILIGWIHWFCIQFSFYFSIGPMEHRNKPNPPMLSSLGEGFNSEGKGYEGIIIAFFCYSSLIWDTLVGCGDKTNCCTAESRISFCFVETSSASLRSHAEFQWNFNYGWTKVVLVLRILWCNPTLTPLCHLSASRRWRHTRRTKKQVDSDTRSNTSHWGDWHYCDIHKNVRRTGQRVLDVDPVAS